MRAYAWQADPGFIIAWFFVPDDVAESPHAWPDDVREHFAPPGTDLVLTREELLTTPERRRALRAWERGDDGVAQRGASAFVAVNARGEVREFAALGCTDAQSILDRGLDADECSRWQEEHSCRDAGCLHGRRRLRSV